MSGESTYNNRHRSFRCEAVVIRHLNFGEADRILWLFSLELGKIQAIAKGVRKAHSRKSGHLEPFMHVSLLLARGKDLLIITQADTINAYLPLREGLIRSSYASYVVELLNRFTSDQEENRAMFRLLVNTLQRLCEDEKHIELALRYYEIRLLDLVGFRPQLYECILCESEIQPEDQYFSVQLGGVVCPSCGSRTMALLPISMLSLKYLRHFQRSSYQESKKASINSEINQELENIMQLYFTYLLERKLNTPPFMRNARANNSKL
jgi:DNA repair protein RecO (recombination protein O)